jgi:hypothetical protein
MTRADLINALGVGSKLSPSALIVARSLEESTRRKNDDDDDDEDGDSTSSEEGNSDDDDDDDDVDIGGGVLTNIIPYTKQGIGGFYSTFCSLGTKVKEPQKHFSI